MSCGKLIGDVNDREQSKENIFKKLKIHEKTLNMKNIAVQEKNLTLQTKIRSLSEDRSEGRET
jgi:hypothetical protein